MPPSVSSPSSDLRILIFVGSVISERCPSTVLLDAHAFFWCLSHLGRLRPAATRSCDVHQLRCFFPVTCCLSGHRVVHQSPLWAFSFIGMSRTRWWKLRGSELQPRGAEPFLRGLPSSAIEYLRRTDPMRAPLMMRCRPGENVDTTRERECHLFFTFTPLHKIVAQNVYCNFCISLEHEANHFRFLQSSSSQSGAG